MISSFSLCCYQAQRLSAQSACFCCYCTINIIDLCRYQPQQPMRSYCGSIDQQCWLNANLALQTWPANHRAAYSPHCIVKLSCEVTAEGLCCDVLCCAVQCFKAPCCAVLCCAALQHLVPCSTAESIRVMCLKQVYPVQAWHRPPKESDQDTNQPESAPAAQQQSSPASSHQQTDRSQNQKDLNLKVNTATMLALMRVVSRPADTLQAKTFCCGCCETGIWLDGALRLAAQALQALMVCMWQHGNATTMSNIVLSLCSILTLYSSWFTDIQSLPKTTVQQCPSICYN